jgi:hypothetical protein
VKGKVSTKYVRTPSSPAILFSYIHCMPPHETLNAFETLDVMSDQDGDGCGTVDYPNQTPMDANFREAVVHRVPRLMTSVSRVEGDLRAVAGRRTPLDLAPQIRSDSAA